MMKRPLVKSVFLTLFIVFTNCQQQTPADQLTSVPTHTPVLRATPVEGAFVSLTADKQQLGVGEYLVVMAEIHHIENLAGAEVHLQFSSGLLEIEDADPGSESVEITHGDFLQPDFVAVNIVDNESGSVEYAIAQMPAHSAVDGSGDLCQIRVKAKGAGTAHIAITSVVLADATGQEIASALVNEALEIEIW